MIHLLRLHNVPIFEQLQIEEALLRADTRDWCLINTGSSEAIVLGISGRLEKLVNKELVERDQISLIRRFSGGGTVFIDCDTVFVTFICNSASFGISSLSRQILKWTETVYQPLFPTSFSVRENDYVLGENKFGGNAQYLQKNRWLHHSSFLWDFKPHKMEYLLLPEKRPAYRKDRLHNDFLCPLHPHFSNKNELLEELINVLRAQFVKMIEVDQADIKSIQEKPHRKATERIAFFN